MKVTIFIIFFFILTDCFAASQHFNLNFEQIENSTAKGWHGWEKSDVFTVAIDKKTSQSGKKSALIEIKGNKGDFKALSYTIPARYQGEKITLRGFIKTENVTDGWAGLWLRIDPSVSFNNMKEQGITGTTEWKRYEITLDLKHNSANNIVIGGLLVGKGKMWLDNLELLIDGVPIEKVPLKKQLSMVQDNEFNEGSKICLIKPDNFTIEKLVVLGKIWGLLKYHHPAIAKGNYNWDFELFRFLPNYLETKNVIERDSALNIWVDSFGEVRDCQNCKKTQESAHLKPDLSWVSQNKLSKPLQIKLKSIYNNRHQGKHVYIDSMPAGNPRFKNESPYSYMPFPDVGYRLLALYRYWNMIHYYFPYKHLIEKDWNEVLPEYIPKFINSSDELAYEKTALLLIADIQDTHANIWGGKNKIESDRGQYYPPVHTQVVEGKLVITDFYTDMVSENEQMSNKVGLKIGDTITTINGISVEKLIQERLPYYPASNYPTKLRDIAPDLLRSNQETVHITFVRNSLTKEKSLQLYKKNEISIFNWYREEANSESFKLLDNNIGYVTLKNIKKEDITKIKEQFVETSGIIIDIRNYPATFVPFSLGSFFVNSPSPFVKFTQVNLNNPGEFTFTPPIEIPASFTPYQGKLIVLVNELSQSQAEYTSMAFRAGHNTTIIGSTTAGADGNVSTIYLPGNLRTMISGIGVYYPDGTETQKVGIVPDIEITPTIEGIKQGKDEVLEKAIEIINTH